MPNSNFPEATEVMLKWGEEAQPVLKDGSLQNGPFGFAIVDCVDSRPNARAAMGQLGDHCMEQVWHEDFVAEARKAFTYTEHGKDLVNLKALNLWRYKWLRPYRNSEAGGRFSQSSYSTFYTLEMHNVPVIAIYATQHDTCAASQGHPQGTRLGWEIALQATVHDMWRAKVGQHGHSVPVFTANIQTVGSKIEHLRLALEFDWQAYDALVPFCDTYKVMLPSEDCHTAKTIELAAWPESTRACVMVEDYQDNLMVQFRRHQRETAA